MAEINLQRKEKAMWPWVVGGIVLVVLVLLLSGVFTDRDDDYNNRREGDTTAVDPAPGVRHQ